MKWNPKDKLYVNPYGWNSKPSRSDEVEYIRKDKVLEILVTAQHLAAAAYKIDEL